MFFPFITGKNFTFRILIELLTAGWLILILLDSRYRPRWSWILGTFTIFIAGMFVADLLSANVFKSFWSNFERMEGFVTLAHLFMYFVIATAVLTKDALWSAFLNTSVGVSAVLGVMGLKELNDFFFKDLGAPRIDVTFGNPTYFAIYAVFHIFITLVLLLRYRGNDYVRYAYVAIVMLNIVMLVFTATRGAILGFLGGIVLTALIIAFLEKERPIFKKVAIGVVGAVLVLVACFFAVKDSDFARNTPVLSRFASINLDTTATTGTVVSRLMIWQMAMQGVAERPIFGWGQESFNFVFNKYYNPKMYKMEPWFDRTHNIVFDWLIAGGIVGALGYFSILFAVLYYLWWYRRDDHPMSIAERALWTGLLSAYFFHNLFVFDNLTSYLMYIVLLAYIHYRVTKDDEPMWSTFKMSESNIKIIVAPVVLVVVCTFIYYANLRSMSTAGYLVDSLRAQEGGLTRNLELYEIALAGEFIGSQEVREQFVQMATRVQRSDAPVELKTTFINRAREAMTEQIERIPNDTRTQLFMGSFLGNIGDSTGSLEYLQNARELSPKKQIILFEIGSRQINIGQRAEALETFKEAYELAPDFKQARDFYALSAVHNGKFDLVEELLVPEYGTIAINDDRFLRAYNTQGRHDVVIQILQKRVDDNPTNPQAYVSLAAGYLNAGNQEKAIELIEKAMEIDPRFKAQGEKFIEDIKSGNTPAGT